MEFRDREKHSTYQEVPLFGLIGVLKELCESLLVGGYSACKDCWRGERTLDVGTNAGHCNFRHVDWMSPKRMVSILLVNSGDGV
jgi:hypothetical protein